MKTKRIGAILIGVVIMAMMVAPSLMADTTDLIVYCAHGGNVHQQAICAAVGGGSMYYLTTHVIPKAIKLGIISAGWGLALGIAVVAIISA